MIDDVSGDRERPKWVRPSPIEVARGLVIGPGSQPVDWSGIEEGSPRLALEAAIAPALEQTPCVVLFSGGRDSSAVLAVTTHFARKLGLPEPVALTRYWPGAPETDESSWQEMVIGHLGLTNWERVPFDEMDIVGEHCASSLAERGLLWPPLIHSWPSMYERVRGGSLLTGEGGDELFEPYRATVLKWVLSDPRRLRSRGAVRGASLAFASRNRRRQRALAQCEEVASPWLTPEHRQAFLEELVQSATDDPLLWSRAAERSLGDRSHEVGLRNLAVMADEHDIQLLHPLLDPAFVVGCRSVAGALGFPGRTAAMRALFGDLLPEALLSRKGKVFTNKVVMGSHTRAFASTWSGLGVDQDVVVVDSLRENWQLEEPPATALFALQSAWLAEHGIEPWGTASR